MKPTTQLVWDWLGSPAWPPAPLKRGQSAPASDRCWLCGGWAGREPWGRDAWLSPTFTNHTLAESPSSDAICQACAYLGSGDAWRAYCAAHPEMGLKSVPPLGWNSYSHVFADGLHECPTRASWRRWLLSPPEPPFVLVLAESGKKHILFRAQVSSERERYWVQVEEDSVAIERGRMGECLDAFEALLALGFTREEVRTGRYSQGRLGKVGLAYIEQDARLTPFRQMDPDYLRIATIAAQGPQKGEK